MRQTFRKLVSSSTSNSSLSLFCKRVNKHPHKLPVSAVLSPPPSSVLVLKLGRRQHDVKLNGCPWGDQVLGFWGSSCFLRTTVSSMNTSWLRSAGMRQDEDEF